MTYKKVKPYLLIILSVIMAFCLFTALFRNSEVSADRSVTISGSSIFYTNGDQAEVWAHEEADSYTAAPGNPEYYSMFVFKDGTGAVNYRKHLAYKWYYNTDEEVDNAADDNEEAEPKTASLTPATGWFNMEIGFESVSFKKYVISFDSQQCTQTKDGKTTNYIMFFPKDGGVQVVISGNQDDAPEESATVLGKDHIKIEFYGNISDGYQVKVSQGEDSAKKEVTGEFHNVGGTFSKYSSSSTTPVTPLSFKAEFEEKTEGSETPDNDYARMVLYNLNGQSFRIGTYRKVEDMSSETNVNLRNYYIKSGRGYERYTNSTIEEGIDYYSYNHGTTERDGHRTGGTINDDAAPVLCFTKDVYYVGLGKELPFDYQLIDVLASSPSADTYYYMLTDAQADNGAFKADNYADGKLFRQVSDTDNQLMEPHKDHFVPTKDNISIYDEENFKVEAAVKVYLKLFDTRTQNINQTTYVLLDWYIPAKNLVEVNGNKYIAVSNDKQGVTFSYTDESNADNPKSDPENEEWQKLLDGYQALVNEAAKGLKAGSKNYFYLPSFENIPYGDSQKGDLFADKVTAYKDLSFNVYYNNGSNGNTTSQKSNSLAINLTKAGKYIFTIYATDDSGNPMYFYTGAEKKTFTASNIWSMRESKSGTEWENTKDYLPWFSFNVEASELSLDDPGERDAAYVGTKYSAISFEGNEVSSKREYELYRFDNDVYYNDVNGGNKTALTYDEFMAQKADLLENHPEWFTEIPAASSLTEGSDEYKEFNKYAWNNTSPEFVPQDANTFYVIKCTVRSTADNLEPKSAYMGISCSAKFRSLKGEDTWLQDNMTSIILLSIAGASLIGIVLLLVIKPKNKGDIDEQFEAKKEKTAKKAKKSK